MALQTSSIIECISRRFQPDSACNWSNMAGSLIDVLSGAGEQGFMSVREPRTLLPV